MSRTINSCNGRTFKLAKFVFLANKTYNFYKFYVFILLIFVLLTLRYFKDFSGSVSIILIIVFFSISILRLPRNEVYISLKDELLRFKYLQHLRCLASNYCTPSTTASANLMTLPPKLTILAVPRLTFSTSNSFLVSYTLMMVFVATSSTMTFCLTYIS